MQGDVLTDLLQDFLCLSDTSTEAKLHELPAWAGARQYGPSVDDENANGVEVRKPELNCHESDGSFDAQDSGLRGTASSLSVSVLSNTEKAIAEPNSTTLVAFHHTCSTLWTRKHQLGSHGVNGFVGGAQVK